MANKNLFMQDYVFYGKHADMVETLTSKIDNDSNAQIFSSFIELFIMSAFVGVKNDHKEKPSIDKSKDKKIFQSQLKNHDKEIQLAFKFVTLLGNSDKYDRIERLNRTFRNPYLDENYENFEEYMLGGLEDIYNAIMLDTNKNFNDYLTSVNDLLAKFSCEGETPETPPDPTGLFD